MEGLAEQQAQLLAGSHAASTVQGYATLWHNFHQFTVSVGRAALPASANVVMDFLTWLDLSGCGRWASAALATIAQEHVLASMASPCADPRVRLLAAGVKHVWAKKGKHNFKHDPFPVQALHHHMRCGLAAGELWLRDTLLVVLGLCTMRRVAKLATLRVNNMWWLPNRGLLLVVIALPFFLLCRKPNTTATTTPTTSTDHTTATPEPQAS